jgi:hypothetical protein
MCRAAALALQSPCNGTAGTSGASWRTERALYQIRVENLFDEEIQTGLSSDGIRTLAGPRTLWLGAEWEF